MSWTRSTFCSNAACVDVCRQGQIVLVRDSAGTVQAWSPREWNELLRLIKWEWTPDGVCELVDGCIEVGLDRHDDKLNYTGEEWDAFKKGVVAEQFEIDKLREFKSSSSAVGVVEEDGAGVTLRGGAPAQPKEPLADVASTTPGAASADGSEWRPSPAAGAGEAGVVGAASTRPAPAAAPFTNLQRVHAIVLTQIRLGGSKTEIAEAIVADLQKGGLIVADPAVETQETGS